jgi:glucuronoarabinoxylan endo-1,4-beta-xylanase
VNDVNVKSALKGAFLFLAFGFFILPVRGGITVVQNVSPGATSWPGAPIISTMANPSSTATVPESFNGGGGNTNLSQTFTIATADYTLQTIDIYAGTGSGTGTGTNIVLKLYDLGVQTAPNPSNYATSIVGTDLLGSGAGLSISYASQTAGVLEFDFNGADQVTLTNGHMYAFELTGAINTQPVFWSRGTTDTYSGGAAYRNQGWINGSNARDFAMAVYATNSITAPPPPPQSGQATVDWSDVHQKIDGFGGGVVFLNPASLDPVTDANMDTLFDTNNANQLGLTLLRVRIDSTTNWSDALSDGQKAVARGAGVLATPWSPPAGMKDNANVIGGSLLPSQYTNYAIYLNNFAGYMTSNGAPLRAISIQNEPDVTVTYESCDWTSNQLQTFCHNVAGLITNAPVLMPESFQYDQTMSDPTLNDPVAAANVTFIGEHLYGNGDAGVPIVDYPNAHNKGKRTWMTEFLVNDQTIGTAITTAKQIHDCLTIGNFSAYIWWKALGDANGLVNASGVPQIRGFVMAQWSRFVRPGYYRISVINTTNTSISAYKDTNSSNFAIVAINTNATTDVNQTFNLTNFTATSVTPWITSGTLSLAVQPAVTVSNASFTYTLPPLSVVTFAGQASMNTPPTLEPVANQTNNVGVTLVITNIATDADLPRQTLTFSPANVFPTGATLDSVSGIFTWRPLVSQANTTSVIAVQVTDNGIPNLSATNSFTVFVNAVTNPVVNSVVISGGQVNLTVSGPQGPDYTLLTTTNLTTGWQTLLTTNSPPIPFTLVDTNSTDSARFYRLQIGP